MITDENLGSGALAVLAQLHEREPSLPLLVLTDGSQPEVAFAAVRAHAHGVLRSPVTADQLVAATQHAIQYAAIERHLHPGGAAPGGTASPPAASSRGRGELRGSSAAMGRVRALVSRVAASDASVLIHGETGTGKELVARAIHEQSSRRGGPMVGINCAALSEGMLESQLFGHVRGAFTDARENHTGLFVQANGGILFLDEVGEMSPGMQAKLLRALQQRCARPVGGTAEVPFDVRVLCSTHRSLEEMVAAKKFRSDLYYRLNVLTVELPPLRSRKQDIIEIALAVLARASQRDGRPLIRLTHAVADRLIAHAWPGNVRELENCIEHIVAMARHDCTTLGDLPEHLQPRARAPLSAARARQNQLEDESGEVTLATYSLACARSALHACDEDEQRAARQLGISLGELRRLLLVESGARPMAGATVH